MTPEQYLKFKEQIQSQRTKLATPAAYYLGDHDLAFATAKFSNAFGKLFTEFAINLCPPVVDAVRDNLEIMNFQVESGDGATAEAAWEIWKQNLMDLRAGEIHKNSLKDGDAFVIVARDAENVVRIYPQAATNCTVLYDIETPGKILLGAKFWIVPDPDRPKQKRVRFNVYEADRFTRWISKKATTDLPATLDGFEEFAPEGQSSEIANDVGRIPVFHFGNNADLGQFGVSELDIVKPVQDALNKSVCDMLVAMEFAAYRQRWIAGLEVDTDSDGKAIAPFAAGIERVWISDLADTKFGDFDATDLEQFLKVKNSFRLDIAMVSGTPLHYFMPIGADFPSGEAIKKAETRFIKKVVNRQIAFGAVWESIFQYALGLDGKNSDVRLLAQWRSPAEIGESEQLDILVKKQAIGVPDEQLQIEAGYGEQDVARFKEAAAESAQRAVDQFNTGILPV